MADETPMTVNPTSLSELSPSTAAPVVRDVSVDGFPMTRVDS